MSWLKGKTPFVSKAAAGLAFLAAALLLGAPALAAAPQKPIHQLRVYEIFEPNKAAFHDRFRDHARRIMRRYDFKILAIWESRSEQKTEFVYLLEWPDEATMKDRWARFMADQEWSDIKAKTRVHGPMVGEIQERTLIPTDYSPSLRASGAAPPP